MALGYQLGRTHPPRGKSESAPSTLTQQEPNLLTTPRRRPEAGPKGESPQSTADLVAQLQTLRAGPDFPSKEWLKIVERIDPAQIPALLAAVEKNPSKVVREQIRMLLLPRWGEADPVGALAYATNQPNKSTREQATMAVLRGWSEKDPAAAATWAR